MSSNYIKNIAVVGASGNVGSHIAKALLNTGKHTVTAITREDSKTEFANDLQVVKANYDDHASLVKALKGRDALVITLAGMAPKDTDAKLINAAVEAGVQFILPNEWSPDTADEVLVRDVPAFAPKEKVRRMIEELGGGKTCYIAVTTGFWYEYSLAIPGGYGFDIQKRAVTFFDDGETKMNTSTWPQVGRAVAALLSLPITSAKDGEHSLEHYRNKQIYISSFAVSQKDIFDSVLRVTGTKQEDWKIEYENAGERFRKGIEAMKGGDMQGFIMSMYSRVFFKDGCGLFEKTRGLVNEVLGLPREDMDAATEVAVERSKGKTWYGA